MTDSTDPTGRWPDALAKRLETCRAWLAKAAAYDNRTVGVANVHAWHDAVYQDITLQDGLDAVSAHYAESGEYLRPVHVNRIVRTVQRERVRADGTPDLPPGLGQGAEKTWRAAYYPAIRAGASRAEAAGLADRAIGQHREAEAPCPLAALVEGQARRWSA